MTHELSLWIVRVLPRNRRSRVFEFHVIAYTHIEAVGMVMQEHPNLIGRQCETQKITSGVIEL